MAIEIFFPYRFGLTKVFDLRKRTKSVPASFFLTSKKKHAVISPLPRLWFTSLNPVSGRKLIFSIYPYLPFWYIIVLTPHGISAFEAVVSNLSIFEYFCHPIFAHNSIKKAAEAVDEKKWWRTTEMC